METKLKTGNGGWIGVDLDGTLAMHDSLTSLDHIGVPIPMMVRRVKKWLEIGENVKIMTARMAAHGISAIGTDAIDALTPIQEWCKEHLGQVLEVTNSKDFGMIELWDDRAVQVIPNTGRIYMMQRECLEGIERMVGDRKFSIERNMRGEKSECAPFYITLPNGEVAESSDLSNAFHVWAAQRFE